MSDGLPIKQIIEGAIMASEQPLSLDQLMQLFEPSQPPRAEVRDALKEIEEDCASRGYELKMVSSGYRFQVKQEYGEWVSRLWKERPPKYSRALLETLALIAYKQPITRGDIEDVRGVAVSTNIIRTLLEREWVRVVGHRDVPGHPALYATTRNFLDYFNLSSLDELPSLAEIRDLAQVNQELDLEDQETPLVLEIDETERAEVAGIQDADLDAVSDRVHEIQENIRSVLDDEEDEDEGEEEAEAEEQASEVDAEGAQAEGDAAPREDSSH